MLYPTKEDCGPYQRTALSLPGYLTVVYIVRCKEPGCETEGTTWPRGSENLTAARRELKKAGWFYSKNGGYSCPAHNPRSLAGREYHKNKRLEARNKNKQNKKVQNDS